MTISWNSQNATAGSIDNGVGTLNGPSGSGQMFIGHTTTFTATFTGAGGSTNCNVTVTVQQMPPQVQAPSCQLTASQSSLTGPGNVVISWTSQNATSGSISSLGSVNAGSGSQSVYVGNTTTYTGTFSGPGGSVNCNVTVTVQPVQQNAPTCQFTASPNSLTGSGSVVFNWSTTNANSVSISGIGSVNQSGSITQTVGSTQNYTLTASGPGGSTNCQQTVTVNQVQQQAPSCTLTATQSGGYGNSATLYWTTYNATSAYITPNVGNVQTGSGSTQVNMPYYSGSNQSYVMTVSGPGGTANCQTSVNYYQPPVYPTYNQQPTCSLYVSQNVVTQGQGVTLSWVSSNANSGYINGVGSAYPTSSGSTVVYPTSSQVYTGTFSGPGGTITCSTQVNAPLGIVYTQRPPDQPLGAVYLSQVPYTGFEAGPALTILFWLSVGLLSAFVAYFIVGKESVRFLVLFAAGLLGFRSKEEPIALQAAHSDNIYGAPYPAFAPISAATAVAPAMSLADAQANGQSVDGIPALADVIESRAHAAGILISPEAVAMAAKLSEDRGDCLRTYGEILNQAVRTMPREDGWIMLNTDRFESLRAEIEKPAQVSPLTPSALNGAMA